MKHGPFIRIFIITTLFCFISTALYAETQPKFDIIPTTATTWSIPSNGFATVSYCVTNRTKITRTLTVSPVPGIVQQTSVVGTAPCATPCSNPFTLAHNQSCFLTLQLDGSQLQGEIVAGPVVCKTNGPGNNTPDPFLCSQPSALNSLHILRTGYEQVLLSVSPTVLGLTENPNSLALPCGAPGVFTVTNHSTTVTAQAVQMTSVTGAAVATSGCSSLAPGASTCTFTVTPGTTHQPPQTVTIQGTNTTATTATVHIAEGIAPISVSPSLLILDIGGPGLALTITNQSACISAKNVTGFLDSTLTLAGVTQTPNPCSASISPSGTCVVTVTPGTNFVLSGLDQFYGTNTTESDIEVEVRPITGASLTITNVSPTTSHPPPSAQTLMLTPNGAAGTIAVQNSSSTVTAINVGSSGLPAGVTQTSANCATILPQGTCTLTYTPGSTIVPTSTFQIVGTNTPAINASVSVTQAQLSISTGSLLLAKNGTFTAQNGCDLEYNCNPGASKTRQLTITNTSSLFTATNVTFSISPALPSQTTISPTAAQGCGNIAPLGHCVLSIAPGTTPTAPAPNAPNPSVLTASGTNTNTVTSSVTVLTYGNSYQSGYVFSMDDTPVLTQSIGGKVSSLSNVATVPWDASSGCNAATPSQCVPVPNTTNFNGVDNTVMIFSALTRAGETPLSFAAGQCVENRTGGYSNWYLPAICELGTDITSTLCKANSGDPLIQNVKNVYNAYPAYPNNVFYWSSTQDGKDTYYFSKVANIPENQSLELWAYYSTPVLCAHVF